MIVTCPSCFVRYTVPDTKIGATGRNIQCVKCQYSWFQTPVGLKSDKENGGEVSEVGRAPLPPVNKLAEDLPSLKRKTTALDAADKLMALPPAVIFGGGVLFMALIALVVALIISNPLSSVPAGYKALTIYEGSREVQDESGLVLTNVERKIIKDGDITVLMFTGFVENRGSLPVTIPEIRVQLLNKRGIELDFWPAKLDVTELEVGDKTAWVVRFLDPDLEKIFEYKAFFWSEE